ncbi:UNVERIFIED_CONTAM: hypothetical protein HDU68_003716, partial [Siphonaria sp. JEL0065]
MRNSKNRNNTMKDKNHSVPDTHSGRGSSSGYSTNSYPAAGSSSSGNSNNHQDVCHDDDDNDDNDDDDEPSQETALDDLKNATKSLAVQVGDVVDNLTD